MPAEIFMGLVCAVAVGLRVAFSVRNWFIGKMSEAFEVGVKIGKATANMGQPWIDEQLRSAGLDPEKLKGRS